MSMGPSQDAPKAPIGALWNRREHAGPAAEAPLVGRAGNAACGDELVLGLWLDGAGRICRARYRVRGCSSLIGLVEWACEELEGLPFRILQDGIDLAVRVRAAGGLPARGAHALGVLERALDSLRGAAGSARGTAADGACSDS